MQERMSAKEYRGKFLKTSKYQNQKTMINGIKFDSKKEANRYTELLILQNTGEIIGLECQKKFILQPAFIKDGKRFREIGYIADFYYRDKSGAEVVEDTKGFRTEVFKLKRKLFEERYPDLTIKII